MNQGCHVIIWTGGRTSSNNAGRRSYLNDSWSYHLLDGKWQPLECKGSYPRRHNHSGVLYQGKLYIFGGQVDGEAYSNQIYTLDCSTYLWQELTPLGPCPSARHGHSCLLYGDYMLLFGGRDGRNNPHFGNDLWIFNLQNNSWKELKVSGNAPCGRYFHGMALLGDLLFVFGGFYWDGRERYLNDLHSVDLSPLRGGPPSSALGSPFSWTRHPAPGPSPRNRAVLVAWGKDSLLLYGGNYFDGSQDHFLGDLWLYSVEGQTWREVHSQGLPPRGHHIACPSQDSIYVMGGECDRKRFNDIFRLTPTRPWQ
uniref:Uncharacterized protein n=1 Tax=Arcella intermedia TaxID=1963864 RepID=A0A6B2LAG0_9EUKA